MGRYSGGREACLPRRSSGSRSQCGPCLSMAPESAGDAGKGSLSSVSVLDCEKRGCSRRGVKAFADGAEVR